jgi:AcrR family transcriptional regulator
MRADDSKIEVPPAGAAKSQLTPEDWVAAAAHLLLDKSIDSVRVDVLAKGLNVTRGSFYWHFKDRNDLLERLLKSWRDAATAQIIDRFEKSGAAPAALIKELILLPFRGRSAIHSASIELSIRAWARRDNMARQVVDEVDAQRLSYIAQCFSALGFGIGEARLRAFMLYSYMITESLLRTQGTDQQHVERREFIEAVVLTPVSAVGPKAALPSP